MRELKLHEMNVVAGGADEMEADPIADTVEELHDLDVDILIEDTSFEVVCLPDHIQHLIEQITASIHLGE